MFINSKKIGNLKNIYYSKYFIWTIIFIGILIRIRQYLFNRSLWIDEASLALNILKLNYAELLTPLLHGQAAPPFFLLLTKLFTAVAGYSEYVLRFLPFICGIVSIILFYPLAAYFLQKKVIPIAISLLSFSYYHIYFTNEFKQYSVDLFFTLLLIMCALKTDNSNFSKKYSTYFGITAIISTWFSHASIFVLGGVGLALLYKLLLERGAGEKNAVKVSQIKELIAIGLLSLFSFALHYFFIIRPVPKGHFYQFWEKGFMPFPPLSLSDIKWYFSTAMGTLKVPLGFEYLYGMAFIFLLIGIIGLWKRKEKLYFNLLMFPVIVLLLASTFRFYPFRGRLVLFILPITYLFISEGISQFIKYFYPHKRLLAVFIVIFLLLYPVFNGISYLFKPILREESRPVIEYCLANKEKDDKIYVYPHAKRAFEYYTRELSLEPLPSVPISRKNTGEYIKELEKLRGTGRVWFIFSHTIQDEDELFLTYLDYIASQLDSYQARGASTYLYNL